MKKTNTSNPLKFFNDAKAARNKSFSKSLIKAQDGRIGPMTQQEAAAETAATSYPGPYANPSVKDQIIKSMGTRPSFADTNSYLKNNTERVNNIEYEKGLNSRSGVMQGRSNDLDTYKRPVRTPQQKLMELEMEREMLNKYNTTPQPTYSEPKISNMQIENVQKKGGTHKMPNGKVMLNSKMKTGGVAKKKFDDGGLTGKQNRLARQEKRVYNKYTDAKTSGNTKKSSKLYDKLMDKQTKSIKAGVNVQYKTGGSTKAIKFAALAPPYNKATAADRIAGAKKNKKK